jgi:hypothetical protein
MGSYSRIGTILRADPDLAEMGRDRVYLLMAPSPHLSRQFNLEGSFGGWFGMKEDRPYIMSFAHRSDRSDSDSPGIKESLS